MKWVGLFGADPEGEKFGFCDMIFFYNWIVCNHSCDRVRLLLLYTEPVWMLYGAEYWQLFLQWETIQFISSDCFDEGDSFSWITGFCGCSLGTSECLLESLWGHFVDNFVKDWPFKKGGNQRYWHFPLCSCMLLILYLLILWWSFEGLFDSWRPWKALTLCRFCSWELYEQFGTTLSSNRSL